MQVLSQSSQNHPDSDHTSGFSIMLIMLIVLIMESGMSRQSGSCPHGQSKKKRQIGKSASREEVVGDVS